LDGPVRGELIRLEGEDFYCIDNFDRMRPFFMSVVSASDLWMFISSSGALTAGRRNPDVALFPYATDDKIHDSAEITGSKTVAILERDGKLHLWEPFSERYRGVYQVRRRLYKNARGSQLIFEEINQDLELSLRYGWFNSDRFGFVRRAWLTNHGARDSRVRLLDGVQNLMPSGVGSQFQIDKSTLLDAYKRCELLSDTGLGIFRLSSVPVDRPEPAEALRATTVWSAGLKSRLILLSSVQLDQFRKGEQLQPETDVRGERGAYLALSEMTLRAGKTTAWMLVADVDQSAAKVVELRRLLRNPERLSRLVLEDVKRGCLDLDRIVASADGFQQTALPLADARHGNNVLFNVMRGGVFAEGYLIPASDLERFVRQANSEVADRQRAFFRRLKPGLSYMRLVALAAATGDLQLERLCREYLPLTFSRRHGDPSRPWNRFSIVVRNPDGSRVLTYEGNWRDIFQNWEALALSYPGYVPGMISRFVSASTPDGYNPYRITREGIDWEVVNPADPWAHIGYWGDHQIIYLLKLLEILEQHDPAALEALLTRDIFAYANVPYRIAGYESLVKDPKNTVSFDDAAERLVQERVRLRGADGKLVWDQNSQVLLVNLAEKLLVSILAKLTNLIPGAGIWLNTQRPEWNDANNALVGNGVSMVTLYYLRRHLAFCLNLFTRLEGQGVRLSAEVARLLAAVSSAFERHQALLARPIDDRDRRRVLDELGTVGTQYRNQIYQQGFSGERTVVEVARLRELFRTALAWLDHSIDGNLRPDGLYHAYNLVSFKGRREVSLRRLYEMLEGQVAVLSSGRLSAEQSLEVLGALRHSAMYRADQHSYLLYPNRDLPRFTERNIIPERDVRASKLLSRLLDKGDRTLVERDLEQRCHFSGALKNAADVRQCLEGLASAGFASLVRRESTQVLEIFERLFDHQSFTGRSGTFFAYEGLGSIYWHMVSKLLLAAQESFCRAVSAGASQDTLRALAECYYDIRAGIGDQKPPGIYGAFPMDPYSHTPAHTGARQPGLTGQVKEDILCRWGELGVVVREGRLCFQPRLLRRKEFLEPSREFRFFDRRGVSRTIQLPPHSLAFTYCQVPVVYRLAEKEGLTVTQADGKRFPAPDGCLDREVSRSVFERSDRVRSLTLALCADRLLE
jgi:hypothetical protein